MDIEFKGGNTIVISTKKGVIAVDPKLSLHGLKDYSGKMTTQLLTQHDFGVASDAIIMDGPGEYEVQDISLKGIAAQRQIDTPDDGKKATMYRLEAGDVSVAIIGHVVSPLTEAQLEAFGMVDILIVPVGGNGYTLDAHGAAQVVRQVEPKIVIPTYYMDEALQYEVPPMDLEPFLKELATTAEETSKLKLKNGALPEKLTVYKITRTS